MKTIEEVVVFLKQKIEETEKDLDEQEGRDVHITSTISGELNALQDVLTYIGE